MNDITDQLRDVVDRVVFESDADCVTKAADEIDLFCALINAWADADDACTEASCSNLTTDAEKRAAQLSVRYAKHALRKAVGR